MLQRERSSGLGIYDGISDMNGGFLDRKAIRVGSNDRGLDKGSEGYLRLLASSNLVAKSSLALGPVAADA